MPMSPPKSALDFCYIRRVPRSCNRSLSRNWKNERKSRMNLFVIGLNHKTAPVEWREQFAVSSSDLVSRAGHLKSCGKLDEIVLLSTCNRVEIYATCGPKSHIDRSLLQSLCAEPRDLRPHTYL